MSSDSYEILHIYSQHIPYISWY